MAAVVPAIPSAPVPRARKPTQSQGSLVDMQCLCRLVVKDDFKGQDVHIRIWRCMLLKAEAWYGCRTGNAPWYVQLILPANG